MRILTITNLYPRPGLESLAPFNRQQLRALSAKHDVRIIAPVPWTRALPGRLGGSHTPRPYTNADGIAVSHPTFYFPPRCLGHLYGQFFLASISAEADGLIARHRPEVIFSCWAHPDGWAASKLARRANVPSVVKVVGSDILVAGHAGRRRSALAEGLGWADAVVAVSGDLARRVAALGVQARRIHVVPEGLDADRFSPGDRSEARRRLGLDPGRPMILFVGNLLMSKGIGVLIEALARLARRGEPPSCILVGRGPDRGRIETAIARLGLAGLVTLAGPKAHDELPDWYRACNLVALPSFSEGIPNVLREAAACGRPYVATRVGGIPEIAGEHACRLVDPGDSSALADALAEVVGWGPQVASAGISWEGSADLLAEVFRSVARNPVSPQANPC